MKPMDRFARLAPVPVMVRSLVFVCALAGMWVAAPERLLHPRMLIMFGLLAVLPALFPAGRWVSLAMTSIAVLWLASTLAVGEPATAGRTFAAACALYLTHSAAALAAVLPVDAVVDISVLLRWAARATLVLFGAAAVTGFVVWFAPGLDPTTSLFAIIGGLGAVALVVLVMSRSSGLRRRV